MKKIFFVHLLCISCLLRAESMDDLLESYRISSDISNITKSESAGFMDIFTRDDIERMQARTLSDIVKLFTVPFTSRTNINTSLLVKPSQLQMPTSSMRIFVNDHDITPSSYQAGAMISESISLDAIDHIEVYRSSASVEFGNEPSTVIIKLYTKEASREEGGKIRVSIDNMGSTYTSAYLAQSASSDLAYLVYGNIYNSQRETYYNQGYALSSDSKNANFYTSINYKNTSFEMGYFQSKSDPFLGAGKEATPQNGDKDTKYGYIHITNKLENGIRFQASVDYIDSKIEMSDQSGIYAGDLGLVTDFSVDTIDKIYSLIVDKTFKSGNNSLFIGGFVKHKQVEVDGEYDTNSVSFNTSYDLYSLYAENKYSLDKDTMLIASLKGDSYRYKDEIEDKNEYIFRLGAIKNIDNFQLKVFYSKTYYTAPLSALYSNNTDTPFITNSSLKFSQPTLYSFALRYKKEKHTVTFRTSYIELKDPIKYDLQNGFINADARSYMQYEGLYEYRFDLKNRVNVSIFYGNRSDDLEFSPAYGANLILYNSYGKFDFFNMLTYKASYSIFGIAVDDSYNWDSSIRYHYTKDIIVGFKGENILNQGYEQVYQNLNYSIPVFDRKFWVNLEYLF